MTHELPAETEAAPNWSVLLDQARAGDSNALGQLCELFRGQLMEVAQRQLSADVQSKLGASDIVQQSFLEAQRDLPLFTGRTESDFRAWVRRIVEHNLLDVTRLFRSTQRRDTAREKPLEFTDDIDRIHHSQKTASSLIRRKETDEELLRAIAHLPAKNQRVVELRHRRGLSHAQIAAELGISEVASRKLWSRTVEQLREMLTTQNHEVRSSTPR